LSEERRDSLAFRFNNEDRLLAHARERIWFGWGNGRNRIYNETGEDVSVTDGYWIIILGIGGAVGFSIALGALAGPVLWARRRLASHGDRSEKTMLAGLALMLALGSVDLLPNGLYSVTPFFLTGVLIRQLRELQPTQ
jgi:hypothetical protein